MRLLPSDPEIDTLVQRIKRKDINLSPEFQRGEVWSVAKQQKLIDSILRDWHIPPIHVIEEASGTVSVLDGQQRLVAIREFVAGKFAVDGNIEPLERQILKLDGMFFDQLPLSVQNRFLRFPIRLFTIVDYKPAEPGELFYRLNQPTSLTPAEQRNAFFGAARSQVKELVRAAVKDSSASGLFGFSNARMTYDDAIARSLYLLDAGTLRQKVTAAALADRFRSERPFSATAKRQIKRALETISEVQQLSEASLKLNKATAESWLVFLGSARSYLLAPRDARAFSHFYLEVEGRLLKGRRSEIAASLSKRFGPRLVARCLALYSDRATSRVADVSSVVLRDFVIWIFFFEFVQMHQIDLKPLRSPHSILRRRLQKGDVDPRELEVLADDIEWGVRL